ncbi:hypothetical protein ACFE04_028689 [Oxalis oulophora]
MARLAKNPFQEYLICLLQQQQQQQQQQWNCEINSKLHHGEKRATNDVEVELDEDPQVLGRDCRDRHFDIRCREERRKSKAPWRENENCVICVGKPIDQSIVASYPMLS